MSDAPRPAPPSRLSERDAERIWRRAAELQAEAARIAETRAREAAAADDSESTDVDEGFSLAEVRDAAVEAGIPPALVERAVLEVEADRIADAEPARSGSAARHVLGETPDAVEVRRVVAGDRDAVLAALAELLPVAPYHLRLVEVVGPPPAEGGLLVFEMTGIQDIASLLGSLSSFAKAMATADFKRFVFGLEPAGDGSRTEVTIRSPLAYSRKLNAWVGGSIAGIGGAISGVAGGLGGAALLGGLAATGPLGAVGLGVAAAAGGGGLLVRGYRKLYRWALRKGETALEELLRDLDTRLRTAGLFAPPVRSPDQPVPAPLEEGDPTLRSLLARRSAR